MIFPWPTLSCKKKLILTLEYSKTRHTFFISFCTAAAVKSSSIFPPIKIYIFSLNDQLSHWAVLTAVPKYISKWSKQTKSKGVGTPIYESWNFSNFFEFYFLRKFKLKLEFPPLGENRTKVMIVWLFFCVYLLVIKWQLRTRKLIMLTMSYVGG